MDSKTCELNMIAQLDIHMFTLGVYPPMSRWVYALTFLRSASQGVDAESCSFTGSLPLWNVELSATPVLPLSSSNDEKIEITGRSFDYAASCI